MGKISRGCCRATCTNPHNTVVHIVMQCTMCNLITENNVHLYPWYTCVLTGMIYVSAVHMGILHCEHLMCYLVLDVLLFLQAVHS